MIYDIDSQDQSLTEAGKFEMEQAAYQLAPLSGLEEPALRPHILTGDKYWYQTAFCLYSLAKTSDRELMPFIFDDGSLRPQQLEALQRLFPSLRYISPSETLERLDAFLPVSYYPSLRSQQQVNPMYKKLLDIHVGQTGWGLQLDSDMLFFDRPDFLIDWCDMPSCSIHLQSIRNAYSASISYLSKLAGRPVRQRVNAGLLGIRSINIDWEQMEYWSRRLTQRGGKSHLLEQTLYALHLTEHEAVALDSKQYVVLPEPPEVHECSAIMHHYIVHSKRWLFQRSWRRFLTK